MIEYKKQEVVIMNNTKLLKATTLILVVSFLLASFSFATVNADDYTQAAEIDTVSVCVIAEQQGEGYSVGDTITPVYRDNKKYFFLPSTANAKALRMMYSGTQKLYIPETNSFVESGETFTCDVSSGSYVFYEYSGDGYGKCTFTFMQSAKVSSMYINLDGGDDDLDIITADKNEYTTGTMRMIDTEGNVVYDNKVDKFKGHGNTSFVAPGVVNDKKSYNIKLSKKAELIAGAGKAKKWTLLHIRVSTAYYYDFTGLTTNLAFSTFTSLAGDEYYGIASEYTDLYINGNYRGTYMLTERMDINAAVSLNDLEDNVLCEDDEYAYESTGSNPYLDGVAEIKYNRNASAVDPDADISGGYLLEIHFNSIDAERCGFKTSRGMYVDIKAPEVCTRDMACYIAKYVQNFEDALYSDSGYNKYGKHYTDYCNLRSLADMILTYAYYQNWELFRTSTYMYIDIDGSGYETLTFGPAWDFETGYEIIASDPTFFGKHNVYSDRQQYIWLEKLWQKTDFMACLLSEGQKLLDITTDLLDREKAGSAYDLYDTVKASEYMNWERWGIEGLLDRHYTQHANTFDFYANAQIEAYRTRYPLFADYLDASKYNFGVKVAGYKRNSDGEMRLIAAPQGNADVTYRWYMLSDDGYTGILLDGETGEMLTPDIEGKYYCVVTGASNASYSGSKSAVFSDSNISVASMVFDTADAEAVDELPVVEHVAGEWSVTKPATCTEEGSEVLRCADCGVVMDTRAIPATGHVPGDWVTVTEATEKNSGLREKHCKVCSAVVDSEKIDRIYINKFKDVKDGDWFADSVKFAVLNDLFAGMTDTTFVPNGNMTRAMLVAVLFRLDGATVADNEVSKFRDVPAATWYTKAVIWAEKNNIVAGTSFDKFSPDDNITREQTAAILFRYATYKEFDVSGRNDITAFSDYSKVSGYALDALAWANNAGIINGMSPTVLSPKGNSTRAQVATMIKGFCGKYPEALND